MESILTNNKEQCFVCGYRASQIHHIYFGTGKRKLSEKYGCKVPLCWNCHKGTFGVHGKYGHKLDLELKKKCQIKFEEKWDHEKFMEVFGKNYL